MHGLIRWKLRAVGQDELGENFVFMSSRIAFETGFLFVALDPVLELTL